MTDQLACGDAVLADADDESLMSSFREGNLEAATQLYERYARRLYALAKSRTPTPLASRLDADDIVQSVFRSFFRSAKAGLYDLPGKTNLWPLLLVIALNKIRAQGVFHTAEKRDVRRTLGMNEEGAIAAAIERLESESNEPFLNSVALDLVEQMPEPIRNVIRLRLDGHTVDEIAVRLQRTKRSIERLLQESRQRFSALLTEDEPDGCDFPG